MRVTWWYSIWPFRSPSALAFNHDISGRRGDKWTVELVRRSLPRALVALAVLACTTAPASAQTAISNIHIDNFGRVNNTYFRGGQPEGHDYAALAAAGIKTIINPTSDDAQANERYPAQLAKAAAAANAPAASKSGSQVWQFG